MPQKVALDWDSQQIRLVVGESNGRSTRITHAAIVPVGEDGLQATLNGWISSHGLTKADALVAVGRDDAELRQMQFPPVPSDELPDMVRFQAIRTFASAGENAYIDYLPAATQTSGEGDSAGVAAIVSASGPAKLDPIRKLVESAGLNVGRLALRPVAAAALFQVAGLESTQHGPSLSELTRSTLALIDIVGDEAELVLFRGRDVSFVRGFRLPTEMNGRISTLSGEIRRSMIACGAGGSPCNVAMWGTPQRHQTEIQQLADKLSAGQPTETKQRLIDPFELVDATDAVRESVGETVGRLAPLIGLLVADANHGDRLIDFENPRRPAEKKSNRGRIAALVGIPAVLLLGMAYAVSSQLSSLNQEIEAAESLNASLRDDVKLADASIARTDRVDLFMDGDVLWLDELQRLAETMPPAEELIVKQISAVADPRSGGGRITIAGAVTSPDVIDKMESDLRDGRHRVVGDGASQIDTDDAYRWQIRETVSIDGTSVRQQRYQLMEEAQPPSIEKSEATNDDAAAPSAVDDPPPLKTQESPTDALEGSDDEVQA